MARTRTTGGNNKGQGTNTNEGNTGNQGSLGISEHVRHVEQLYNEVVIGENLTGEGPGIQGQGNQGKMGTNDIEMEAESDGKSEIKEVKKVEVKEGEKSEVKKDDEKVEKEGEEMKEKVETARQGVERMQIKKMVLKWSLADEAEKLDEDGDKMGLFLNFLGREMEKKGVNKVELGWYEGENLVQYIQKFGKGIKGKNIFVCAIQSGITWSSRETCNMEVANEVLKSREKLDEREEELREIERKRPRWADQMSDEEKENARVRGQEGNNQGGWGQQNRFNRANAWDRYDRQYGRDNRGRGQFNEGQGQFMRDQRAQKIEVDESRANGYTVIETENFENGLFGLKDRKGFRCFGVATMGSIIMSDSVKGVWNAILKVDRTNEGDEIIEIFQNNMAREVEDFIYGDDMAFCCGCKSGRGLYKFRKIGFIWGTRRERIMILKLGPMGTTNLGLNLDNGMHECGNHTSWD